MNAARTALGIIGAVVTGTGVFGPALYSPVFDGPTLFGSGRGDGVLILACAVAMLTFALTGASQRWLLGSGIVSLILSIIDAFAVNNRLEAINRQAGGTEGLAGVVVQLGAGTVHIGWGVFAVCLGPVIVCIAGLISAAESHDEPPVGMKKCPDCAELIREGARKCRFCGATQLTPDLPKLAAPVEVPLPVSAQPSPPEPKVTTNWRRRLTAIAVGLGALVVIGGIAIAVGDRTSARDAERLSAYMAAHRLIENEAFRRHWDATLPNYREVRYSKIDDSTYEIRGRLNVAGEGARSFLCRVRKTQSGWASTEPVVYGP